MTPQSSDASPITSPALLSWSILLMVSVMYASKQFWWSVAGITSACLAFTVVWGGAESTDGGLVHWVCDLSDLSLPGYNILLYHLVNLNLLWCVCVCVIYKSCYRKEMFEKVHYFIHFNLAIALFLAYLLFVLGIQLARENQVQYMHTNTYKHCCTS